ncbi:mycorrhiza-induced NACHT/WD-repeat protein, partial [Reticulomyxa filosa]
MQNDNPPNEENRKYKKETKILRKLFGDLVQKEELQQKMEHYNGDIESVIKEIIQQSIENEKQKDAENESTLRRINSSGLQKEMEKAEIGETRPGINLQGYCTNETCLASKGKLPVWINVGFGNISFVPNANLFCCPDCKKLTVTSIAKAMFYNSEHSICSSSDLIPVKANNYQCSYPIQSGLSYELQAQNIRQHAASIEDLRERSEHAMNSKEIIDLVTELQKYEITVVKPPSLKGNERLLEKIQADYGGDFNQAFDIGRFTILCDNPIKLQTAVAVLKKAEQFHLIVSEDKDFFEKQSKTHHRFHNIKLYVPKHDVYIEMQATLKHFTTLEGYTVIENPKLSHLFYEQIRAWKPNNSTKEEEELKQASDEMLTKINDIICEWISEKEIKKISNRYKPYSEIGIFKPPQLREITEEQINIGNDVPLKLTKFVYDQLCTFNPIQMKAKAIYMVLFDYFKKHIMGVANPVSCEEVALILQEAREKELEEDSAIAQALETYIPLHANNYPYIGNDNNDKTTGYDCYQRVIEFLEEEKKSDQQREVMILQGKSGSGKSLFCRHLEETLWKTYDSNPKKPLPVYISLPKCYSGLNEQQLISQALQMKQINKEMIDAIREKTSFVFLLDGFDEIFDIYANNNPNERSVYNRFNFGQWNAKVIVTCRSNVLNDEDIKQVLIGSNSATTSMMYLWPFSKDQMHGYIDKFVQLNQKNKMNGNFDWTTRQCEETLKNYPNLNKMMEEPFLLQLILTVLPVLTKQHSVGTKISKAQVYEAFNEQWLDLHIQNISSKLAELRIQTNLKKIKTRFERYCLDLGFEMFIQGSHIATENDSTQYDNAETTIADPKIEWKNKIDVNEEIEEKTNKTATSTSKTKSIWKYFGGESISKYTSKGSEKNKSQNVDENVEIKTRNEMDTPNLETQDVWEKYFNGDSIAKYVLRRIGNNKYQFLHKSCQEYYAAAKIISDIISWKPNANIGFDDRQFQQRFERRIPSLLINCKLLNEEPGIVKFIAERIHDTKPVFTNLKSRLFRIIDASKTNEKVCIAAANAITILNSASVNMHYQNWSNIKIPYAILDYSFLEGTNFKNANLDHVSFHQTYLNNANFTKASMNGVHFGEYAYLEGHSGDVIRVQYFPDGSKVVSCSNDRTIRVWDVSSGKQLQVLKGNSNSITDAQFSPNDFKTTAYSENNIIQIWDTLSGKQLQMMKGHSGLITGLRFSPDGSKIVSYSEDKSIRIWDVSSGEQIQLCEGHSGTVTGALFSHDGSKIVSRSYDKTVRVWDVMSGNQLQIIQGHANSATIVQFSPDGSKIVTSSNDQTIRIWNTLSGEHIQSLEGHSGTVTGVQFSSDSLKLISRSHDKTIRVWDILSKLQLQKMEGHSGSINDVQFSPDESKIVSCSNDQTIRIWNVSSGKQLQSLEGHLGPVTAVQFASDGSKIVSCSRDKLIRIWDVLSGEHVQLLEGHANWITGVQFSSDVSGKQLQVLEGHSNWVTGMHFSPDGSKLVTCSSDKTIRLWDVLSGKQLSKMIEYSCEINSVQFSTDGLKIVLYSYDESIRIWDISSGNETQLSEGRSNWALSMRFSLDGSKIVSCLEDKSIRILDASSGQQIQLMEGHSNWVTGVQFSPDGSKIITCSNDQIIRIWDILSGKQLQQMEGHSSEVNAAQFSPDGSKI